MRVFFIVMLIVLAGCRPPDAGTADAAASAEGGVRVSLELADRPAVGPAVVRVYLLGATTTPSWTLLSPSPAP